MQRIAGRACVGLAVVAAVAYAGPADAYTVQTVITPGCHEAITMSALRTARASSPAAAPLPLVTSDDSALALDLPYTPAPDMQDLGAIALVLGVRSNDLKGISVDDLDELAVIQGDPTTQDEHCLRNGDDLEPGGTPQAIAQCRAFILGRVSAALGYIGPDGAPSSALRTGLDVSLVIRGEVTVPLPGYYVNLGQALHALEDSFSHTFRADAAGPITASLNFLEIVNGDTNQAVYGPPHRSGLDACEGLDPERQAKMTAAEAAATALLLATLGPGTKDDRLAKAGKVLDTYLAYKPGCTAANSWCNAPEQAYAESASCSVGWGQGGLGAGAALFAIGALLLVRRKGRVGALGLFLAIPVASLAAARPAQADEVGPVRPVDARPTPEADPASRWGMAVATGVALDRGAFAFAAGARFEITHAWLVGVDAEYNPWFSFTTPRVTAGAFNAYASGIHRWGTGNKVYDLRTSIRVGSSTEIVPLFGVPRGSTGVFLGGDLLGIEFHLPRHLAFVFEPAEVAFPVPQLRGTPFGYLQYRVMVALQWGAGP